MYNSHMLRARNFVIVLLMLLLISLPSPLPGRASSITPLILNTPGDGSRLTSPIHVSARIQSQEGGLIRLALINRANITITRQLLRLDPKFNSPADFTSDLAFEIPVVETEGLLTIAIQDMKNRRVALRSAFITLQSRGEGNIITPASISDWLSITQPEAGDSIRGGVVVVAGTIEPIVATPVFFELILENNRQIGTRQLLVESAGEEIQFNIDIPYLAIDGMHDVRLVVRQSDRLYGETIILDSLLIYLSP